ncbi:MAG TPA: dienelactone hydrolase family protein [Candidatus Polarisedimenticolaceae bacterium]|nr:dienelactone hydrolase family protein [Candidatus Polarisedimenticolaceae bacterium]
MARTKAGDYSPQVLRLFDRFVHGEISRREFLDRAASLVVAGVSAAALLDALTPDFAAGQLIAADDSRLATSRPEYDSPRGGGKMRGYLARGAAGPERLPGVLVIHENRGLNPHIEDIARRLAVEGYLAFAPDALAPLGGYPGDEDKARELFRELDRDKLVEDFVAAFEFLDAHPGCTGKVGAVGFCFGGGMVNRLAVRLPKLDAGVAFYGGQVPADQAAKIEAPLLLHYAGIDDRINAGWPAYKAALESAGVRFEAFVYEGVHHGFNNDTTPRFDEEAAGLAWRRTLEFFDKYLR